MIRWRIKFLSLCLLVLSMCFSTSVAWGDDTGTDPNTSSNSTEPAPATTGHGGTPEGKTQAGKQDPLPTEQTNAVLKAARDYSNQLPAFTQAINKLDLDFSDAIQALIQEKDKLPENSDERVALEAAITRLTELRKQQPEEPEEKESSAAPEGPEGFLSSFPQPEKPSGRIDTRTGRPIRQPEFSGAPPPPGGRNPLADKKKAAIKAGVDRVHKVSSRVSELVKAGVPSDVIDTLYPPTTREIFPSSSDLSTPETPNDPAQSTANLALSNRERSELIRESKNPTEVEGLLENYDKAFRTPLPSELIPELGKLDPERIQKLETLLSNPLTLKIKVEQTLGLISAKYR